MLKHLSQYVLSIFAIAISIFTVMSLLSTWNIILSEAIYDKCVTSLFIVSCSGLVVLIGIKIVEVKHLSR